MPTPSCESLQEFLNEYDKYCASTQYADQWLKNIISAGECLQNNLNYDIALSEQERAALEANILAAQGTEIIPIAPPVNIPNPPKI